VDAADLHLHAGSLPGRACYLLGLEQLALGAAAERDHAQERREDFALGQSQRHLHAHQAEDAGGIKFRGNRPYSPRETERYICLSK
jgi:hypothetical protein